MTSLDLIVVWGAASLLSAVACGVIARRKNRNVSAWIAWGFLLPPAVFVLLPLRKRQGSFVRKSVEEEERDFHRG